MRMWSGMRVGQHISATLFFLELFLLSEQKKKWIGTEILSSHDNSIKYMQYLDSVRFSLHLREASRSFSFRISSAF